MLNECFRLNAGASTDTVGVVWTAADAEWVSHLFVNGRLAAEAFAPGTAERSIDVPLPAGTLAVIEVHDFAPDDVPDDPPRAIAISPQAYTCPTIRFAAVPAAARYRLYHRPENGPEVRLCEITADPDLGDWIALECPVDLSGRPTASGGIGGWHFFRVEAVSVSGVESLTQAWAWRAMDVPVPPTVSVAAGQEPGTYSFRLTGE